MGWPKHRSICEDADIVCPKRAVSKWDCLPAQCHVLVSKVSCSMLEPCWWSHAKAIKMFTPCCRSMI